MKYIFVHVKYVSRVCGVRSWGVGSTFRGRGKYVLGAWEVSSLGALISVLEWKSLNYILSV